MHLICLHNVIPGPVDAFDEKCSRISVDEFEGFLDEVSARFTLISYSDYEARLRSGSTDDAIVALSFDDGFLGVFDHAKPVLDARGLDAIAFINPPYLGNPPGRIFHFLELEIAFRLSKETRLQASFLETPLDLSAEKPRVKALKTIKKLLKTRPEADRATGHAEVLSRLGVTLAEIVSYAHADGKFGLMSEDQIRQLSDSGWTIGSHAMTHRTLSMLPTAEMEHEIATSSQFFEDRFGWTSLPFAYPYGDAIHVGTAAPEACARAGHPMAYTTIPGPSQFASSPHVLPRIDYKRFVREQTLLQAAE